MGWAGPSATRQMGDPGAAVIKVESCQYPDWFRGTDTRGPYYPERTYEKIYWFQQMNRNKRGIQSSPFSVSELRSSASSYQIFAMHGN
eukprot:gene59727-81723_t